MIRLKSYNEPMLMNEADAKDYYKLSSRIKRFFLRVLCTIGWHKRDFVIISTIDFMDVNFEIKRVFCRHCGEERGGL